MQSYFKNNHLTWRDLFEDDLNLADSSSYLSSQRSGLISCPEEQLQVQSFFFIFAVALTLHGAYFLWGLNAIKNLHFFQKNVVLSILYLYRTDGQPLSPWVNCTSYSLLYPLHQCGLLRPLTFWGSAVSLVFRRCLVITNDTITC